MHLINGTLYSLLLFNPFQTSPAKQALVFTCPQYKSFENTVGKGEIAHNEQVLPFPQCFLLIWGTFCHLDHILKLLSANSFSVEESKFHRLGKG